MTDQTADQNRQFLTMLADLGIATHRLDQIRDAARLHRQQLIGTSELYAVIEADAPAVSAGVAPATDQAAVLLGAAEVSERPRLNVTPLPAEALAADEVFVDAAAFRAAVLREAADAIDAETRQAKADEVLEPEKFRPCRDASAQLRRMAAEAGPADTVRQDDGETEGACPRCKGSGIDPEDDLIPGSSWELPQAPPCRSCTPSEQPAAAQPPPKEA